MCIRLYRPVIYRSVFPPSESCWVLCTASAVMADGSCNHSYLICGHIPFHPSVWILVCVPIQCRWKSTVNVATSIAEHVQTGIASLELPRCIQADIKNAEVTFLTPKWFYFTVPSVFPKYMMIQLLHTAFNGCLHWLNTFWHRITFFSWAHSLGMDSPLVLKL